MNSTKINRNIRKSQKFKENKNRVEFVEFPNITFNEHFENEINILNNERLSFDLDK